MKYLILLTAAALLCGCASTPTKEWYRTGATSEQFSADRARCEYEAELGTPDRDTHGVGDAAVVGFEEGWRKGKLEIMCLQAHGWQLREKAN